MLSLLGLFTYRKERRNLPAGKAKKMTTMTSNRIKRLTISAAIACMLGGGVGAVLLPTFASASSTVAKGGVEDAPGVHKGGIDPAGHAKGGIEDTAGQVRNGGEHPANHA